MKELTDQELCNKGQNKLQSLERVMEEAAVRASNAGEMDVLEDVNEIRCCLLQVHTLSAKVATKKKLKIGGK